MSAAKCIVSSLEGDSKAKIPTAVIAKINLTADMMKWNLTRLSGEWRATVRIPLTYPTVSSVNTSTATIKFADGTTEFTAAENLLVGTTAPTFVNQEVGDYTNFALSAANGDFRKIKAEGMVVPANKAYLPVPTDKIPKTAARLIFVFEDGEQTTGISEECRVKSEEFAPAIYDLQGRKVAQPKKGLYIVNGRKVVMK
jgi:hypothetical protein